MKSETCRHCEEEFTPAPDKPGYVDECPQCLYEIAAAKQPKEKPALQRILDYVALHPPTVRSDNEELMVGRTRSELVQKLRRRNLSEQTITKLADAYIQAVKASLA